MGSSFWSRALVTLFFLLLAVLFWESLLSWRRYEPETGRLGGLRLERGKVLVVEPGWSGQPGPGLPASRLRGVRYAVLTPLAPSSSLLGSGSRVRLVGVFLAPEDGNGPPRLTPWGGGLDPLAEFLFMTRLLTERLVPRIRVGIHDFELTESDLQAPQVLRFEGADLVLAPGS